MALSVTASCGIKQAKRELCKMSMHDMQLNMEFGEYLFSKGNITLLKCTWNSCGGLKHPSLTCQINRFFVFIKWTYICVILHYRPFLGGGCPCANRAYLYLTSWAGSVLLGPGICLSVSITCTCTSDGWGWKYLWQLKCFAWKLFWGFFEVTVFRLQGVNSPSKRFCFLIAANDCGAIKHSPLCSCF